MPQKTSAEDIIEKIYTVLGKGDILLVVPPMATIKTPILGPLILQTISENLGFSTQIFHMNLLMASLIGPDLYENISLGQPFRFMGERLFARSAHGLPALGRNSELCLNPASSVFGEGFVWHINSFEYKYYVPTDFDLNAFFKIEETCTLFIDAVSKAIASLDFKIVGCSCNWEQNNCSVALIKRIKQAKQEIVTIIGGCNCEGEMAEGIASLCGDIDYVFSGESEESFFNFLKQYSAGAFPDNRIIKGKPVENLDSIPLPSMDSYIVQREHFLGEDAKANWSIGYETSRGCWWGKCNFCGLNGEGRRLFRKKSANKALKDFEQLHNRYPKRSIGMVDKVMPRSYLKKVLPILSLKENLPSMSYEQRSDISFDALFALRKSGFVSIKPGIEALSDGLLKIMNKGVTAAQNILLLRHARSMGIYVDWNLLWGFPGEKIKDYKETFALLPLLRHLCPPAVFRHISIDRFSPYFQSPEKFQITNLRPWASYSSVYPDKTDLSKIACRFIGDYPSQAHDNPDLISELAEEVEKWKNNWQTTHLKLQPMMGAFMVVDTREGKVNLKNHILDYGRAKEIMVPAVYRKSDNQRWAMERKLAVVINSDFVPLVTLSPELYREFSNICK